MSGGEPTCASRRNNGRNPDVVPKAREVVMRLLITGWHGQLARSLAEAATHRPAITSLSIGRPALDLCARPSILRTLADNSPDVIVNAAAYTAVDKAESEPDAAFS